MFAEYPWNISMRYSQYIWEKIPYEISGIFRYYEMRPVSNQPARFFVTAKTHKFKSLEKINVDQLKLRPIVDQTGTYIYNTSKVIAEYLKPLAKNEFTISGTLTFSDLVKCASNSNEYENISYDVEPLSQVY